MNTRPAERYPPTLGAGGVLPPVPRLFAIDVDGTLLTSDHRVSPETKRAVHRVRSTGIEVVLATSRGPRALLPILLELGLLDPAVFVGSQGALTGSYDAAGNLEVAAQRSMALEPARQFVQEALSLGLSVHWFRGPQWLVSHLDETAAAEAREVRATPEVRDLFGETLPPDKMMVIASEGSPGALGRLAQGLPDGLVAQVSNPGFLEITHVGVDKGQAVAGHCRARGLEPAQVVAIGDGPNDLGLFAMAGTSIAPANARAAVLAAATFVTAQTNDEDAVAFVLDALVP
jgi:Cof subfamily protein (haloacid dehalogenase superfamily)